MDISVTNGVKTVVIQFAPMSLDTVIMIRKKLGYNKIYQNDEILEILSEDYHLDDMITKIQEFENVEIIYS